MPITFEQPGPPGAEQAAYGYGALQTALATQPTQKDIFQAQVQAAGADQQFQQRASLQQQSAILQGQLASAQLSQGEQMRLARLRNALDYVENDPSISPDEKANLRTQIQTGINPLQQRQQRAQATASELQMQQMQQQHAAASAMNMTVEQHQASQRANYTDPNTNTRYWLGANGQPLGTFDTDNQFVPFGVLSQRERAQEATRQREERQQEVREQRDANELTRIEHDVRSEMAHFNTQMQQWAAHGSPEAERPRLPWLASELERRGRERPRANNEAWRPEHLTHEELESLISRTSSQRFGARRNQPQARQDSPPPTELPREDPHVPPEVALQPSSISAERVGQLRNVAVDAYNRTSYASRLGPNRTLGQMADVLIRAHDEDRPLTIAERAWYERFLNSYESENPQLARRLRLIETPYDANNRVGPRNFE